MTVLTAPLRRARVVALRVPRITIASWVIKALSTALGESTSDYKVKVIDPVLAVAIGFVAFVLALGIQLTRGRYLVWADWLAVVMVGVFGTMAADVAHVVLGLDDRILSLACAIAHAVRGAGFRSWRWNPIVTFWAA